MSALMNPTTCPYVSVIVPTRNRRESLHRTLDALEAQTYERFEVVVVDDASVDGTSASLQQHRWRIRLTLVQGNGLGPAAARNKGLAQARGELIAFTDSDCVPDSGWLTAGVASFDDDVDVVQGRTERDPFASHWPFDRSVTV